jgi:hypothetical protein
MTTGKPTNAVGPFGCSAALNVDGEHYWCDNPLYPHTGWAHQNTKAHALWFGDNERPGDTGPWT